MAQALLSVGASMQRILIVDDDPDFCALVRENLTHAGYDVTAVGSAREANHVIASAPPALAIVDGFLADRDGESWIAAQRRAGNAALKIIFVSAFGTYARDFQTQQRLVRELGVSHVLSKPVEIDTLRGYVDELLDQTTGLPVLAKLSDLRRSYGTELTQKVAVIATSIALARSSRSSSPLEEARRLAHTLEGTAGSYGFTDVGEAAGRVFALLDRQTLLWEQIDACIRELRRRVETAQAAI